MTMRRNNRQTDQKYAEFSARGDVMFHFVNTITLNSTLSAHLDPENVWFCLINKLRRFFVARPAADTRNCAIINQVCPDPDLNTAQL